MGIELTEACLKWAIDCSQRSWNCDFEHTLSRSQNQTSVPMTDSLFLRKTSMKYDMIGLGKPRSDQIGLARIRTLRKIL